MANRRWQGQWVTPVQVRLSDLLCERVGVLGQEAIIFPIGRVSAKGENEDSTIDLFIASFVDQGGSWYKYHKDEDVLVVRHTRWEAQNGERDNPRY